jgi:hypothetical protein
MDNHTVRLRELTDLLQAELRLVGELRDALVRQRAGVAGDDRAIVETSLDEIGRAVFALRETRGHRAAVVGAITGDPGFPLARLEERVPGALPEALRRVRGELREAAQSATVEVNINHAVLRRAVEAGETFLQSLFASAADPPAGYGAGPPAGAPEPSPGRLLDRSA